jgi:hypothetical protein
MDAPAIVDHMGPRSSPSPAEPMQCQRSRSSRTSSPPANRDQYAIGIPEVRHSAFRELTGLDEIVFTPLSDLEWLLQDRFALASALTLKTKRATSAMTILGLN